MIRTRIGTMLLAVVLALPNAALAANKPGGGGGFHPGGGGGGGAFHPSISGGGGFHPNVGGGAFHPNLGGGAFHPNIGGNFRPAFTGTFRSHGFNSGGRGPFISSHGLNVGSRSLRFNGSRLSRSAGISPRVGRTVRPPSGLQTPGNIAALHNPRFPGHLEGRFASRGNWHRFRGAYGWAGPLFWPYAYDDIYDDVFWGYSYDPFWDYGYGDIFGGLFSPYGFNDLAGYLPGGTPGRSAGAPQTQPSLPGQLGQMCGDDTKEVAGWPIARIQQLVSPDDRQRAALDALADASVQAARTIKSACPTTVAFTAAGRLDAMQARLEAMSRAINLVRGPVESFYATLSDEQKARLNAGILTPEQRAAQTRGSVVRNCNAVNAATQWPAAQIEMAVHPTPEQQGKLDALKDAVTAAANELSATCPLEMPATPPARLTAISGRIAVMLQAVKHVHAALDDFYGSLDDEQKAQFNMIGQPRTTQR